MSDCGLAEALAGMRERMKGQTGSGYRHHAGCGWKREAWGGSPREKGYVQQGRWAKEGSWEGRVQGVGLNWSFGGAKGWL